MFKFISATITSVCASFTDILTLVDIAVDESIHESLDSASVGIDKLSTTHQQRIAHLHAITARRAGIPAKAAK
jgi:hypothetical protein